MLKVSVKTDLPAQIERAITDMDRRQAALLQELGQELLNQQRLDFETKSRGGTGADGTTWAPLAESTERKKYMKGLRRRSRRKDGTRPNRKRLIGPVPRSQIGVDTGIMRNCVTPGYKAPDGDGGNILEISGASVTVGYQREYAPWFDEGTDTQPARPLMPNTLPQAWQEKLDRIAENWVNDIVEGIGQ